MSKPHARSSFWRCPYFSTLFCSNLECETAPPCAVGECKSIGCIVVDPITLERSVCQAPDCPCWSGNATVQRTLQCRREAYLATALHYLNWCRRAERASHGLPTHDLGVWIDTYETLKSVGAYDDDELYTYFVKLYHAQRRDGTDDDDKEN